MRREESVDESGLGGRGGKRSGHCVEFGVGKRGQVVREVGAFEEEGGELSGKIGVGLAVDKLGDGVGEIALGEAF